MEKISPHQRKLILHLPLHQQFDIHISRVNGGVVLVHKLVDRSGNDFKQLITIGQVLAKEARMVELLPILHEKDVDFRQKVLPGARMNKNPDLRIDGEYWEVEAPEWPYRTKNISNRIRRGQDQADALILFFAKEVKIKSVESIIKAGFKHHARFKKAEIWVNFKKMGTLIK